MLYFESIKIKCVLAQVVGALHASERERNTLVLGLNFPSRASRRGDSTRVFASALESEESYVYKRGLTGYTFDHTNV